jgi:hypothetical protein
LKLIRRLILTAPTLALILILSLSSTSTIIGQSAIPQDTVLQAFEQLQEQDYTFTAETTLNAHYTDASEVTTPLISIALMSGYVQSNGNRQINLKQFSGEDLTDALVSRAMIIDQIRLDGELYVNVGNIEYLAVIEPGWWRYDELTAQPEGETLKLRLDSFVNVPTPSEYQFDPEFITSVTEQEPETLNDVPMRVFDVEMDAQALTIAQLPGTDEEKQEQIAKNKDLIDATELSISYRLWIGAEDGLLYRGLVTSYTFYPYATLGGEDSGFPPYDIEINSTVSFDITGYNVDQTITTPETLNTP